jgi:hypothetical protein
MSILRFNDGVTMRTDGPYRVEKHPDGYYVLGHGYMSAVKDWATGIAEVNRMKMQKLQGILKQIDRHETINKEDMYLIKELISKSLE